MITPTPLPWRFRLILSRLIPAAALLCFLAWCYVSVRPAHSWDDAEPEVLNQAWRLAQGKPIYPSIDAPAEDAHRELVAARCRLPLVCVQGIHPALRLVLRRESN